MVKRNIKPAFRPLRLRGYDYSSAGAYFVTICAQDRKSIFGRITETSMILNQAGQLVLDVWNNLPGRFSRLNLDAFIIMPNHVHGILIFPGTIARSAGSSPNIRKRDSRSNPRSQPQCPSQNVVSGLALPHENISGTHPCSKRQSTSQNNVVSGLALPQEKACLSLENLKTSSAKKSGKMSETCTNPKEEYSLGEVVGAFKPLSTREINKRFKRSGPIWSPSQKRVETPHEMGA